MKWNKFQEKEPTLGDYIVIKDKYKRSGHYQGIVDEISPQRAAVGDNIVGVKNAMPVFHDGSFIHFTEGFYRPITDELLWIKIE